MLGQYPSATELLPGNVSDWETLWSNNRKDYILFIIWKQKIDKHEQEDIGIYFNT